MAMRRLRCLTFNLWKNEGNLEARVGAIRQVIARADADVVALQECFVAADLGIDLAAELAAEAGFHLHRQPMREKVRSHRGTPVASRSDLALLTRDPVAATGWIALSTDQRDGERGLIWADCPVVSGDVRVVCTHLTHLPGSHGKALRERQAEELACRLTSWTQFGPAILLGDLNAPAGAKELQPLFENPLLPVRSAPPSWADNGIGRSRPIDHALLFPGAAVIHYLGLRQLTDPAREPMEAWASDHPAMLAEFGFV